MPNYLVTDPNTGQKLRLTGDSPPTEQELEEIFAQQAGSASGAMSQPVTQGITQQKQPVLPAPSVDLPEIGNAPELNELSFGALKTSFGLLSTGDEKEARNIIKQNIPNATFRETADTGTVVDLPSGSYLLNRPGLSPQDVVKGLFDIAAFTPAGRAASIPKAIGAAAATEAALESGEAAVGGQFDSTDVALAGGLGGVGKGIETGVSAIGRYAQGQAKPAIEQVIRSGEQFDVPVLTTDVIEPKTFFGRFAQATAEKIPVAGTGGVRAAQQEARQGAIRSFAADYGFTPRPEDIVQSLKSKKQQIKSLAGQRYERIAADMDARGPMAINATIKSIDDVIDSMSRPGVVRDTGIIDDLQKLKQTLAESPQSFSMMRENRTNFRDIVNATDSSQRSQLPSFAKKKLQGVMQAMTKDMDDFVKGATPGQFGKYKNADEIYRREAQELTRSRLKGVLDKGDITPEQVNLMLFSNKPSENKILFNALTSEGRQAARSGLISKAIKDSGGIDDFSVERFTNILKRNKDQYDTFFRGKDRAQLDGLMKLLDATRRAPQAALTPPTGVQAVGVAGLGGAIIDLGATLMAGGSAGGIARIYESPPVRNFLVKLANTPAGSTEFDRLVSMVGTSLLTGAQAAREAE